MAKKELVGLVSKDEFFKVKDDTPWVTDFDESGVYRISDQTHAGKVWCQVASVSEFYQLLSDYNAFKGISYTETEEERKIREGDAVQEG